VPPIVCSKNIGDGPIKVAPFQNKKGKKKKKKKKRVGGIHPYYI
jgi:hypothetical protein